MNKRQKRKLYKKHVTTLANDGRKFKSKQAKKNWIRVTCAGYGTAFTKYYLEGYPESPYKL